MKESVEHEEGWLVFVCICINRTDKEMRRNYSFLCVAWLSVSTSVIQYHSGDNDYSLLKLFEEVAENEL